MLFSSCRPLLPNNRSVPFHTTHALSEYWASLVSRNCNLRQLIIDLQARGAGFLPGILPPKVE
ncbi:hypothetical protein HanIR_Chr07g0337081 [Helianthus annuus]|nr:hypothetical protein HanIR_Chr07g0337081 [Helianthus annuus]